MSPPRENVSFQVIDDDNIAGLNDFLVLSIACTTIIVQGLIIKKAFNLFKGDLCTIVEFLMEILHIPLPKQITFFPVQLCPLNNGLQLGGIMIIKDEIPVT